MGPRGRFITLEGGEGVGKSTLAKALKARLDDRGFKVVVTREPGGTPGAEALRQVVLSPPPGVAWTPLAEALLFNAARVDHLERLIRPALAHGEWVVCDRFADSTRAYQTAGDPASAEIVETLDRLCVGASQPDLTLILDLDPKAGRERLASRGSRGDAIEDRDAAYHARVRQAFLDIAKREPRRCAVLDAALAADALADAAMAVIDQRIAGGA